VSDPKAYYITTPIYYINALPHIGNAYTTIVADTLARFNRARGRDVVFATGTDEHAEKVLQAAEAQSLEPKVFADGLADGFREAWARLGITYDDFIRTSEERHHRATGEVVRRMMDSGDIYKGDYEGWYCVSCATFFPDTDSDSPNCPNEECGKPLERRKQPSYFFRLSAYGDRLLKHFQENPEFVVPEFRKNEVVSFIESGLHDCCISRSSNGWGVPFPGDEEQQVYVWFDALINYLTVTGWPDEDGDYQRLWPCDVHLVGKDILTRFHATLWPAMLMSIGVPLPKTVAAHGFWLNKDRKISKSGGGLVSVDQLAEEMGEMVEVDRDVAYDAVRYFALREMTFGQDAEFSREALWGRFNADLANDLGNVLNRSLPLIERSFEGVIPEGSYDPDIDESVKRAAKLSEERVDDFDFRGALDAIWESIGNLNKYLDTKAPWNLVRDDEAAAKDCLLTTCEAIRRLSILLTPFIPHAAMEVRSQLGLAVGTEGTFEEELSGGPRVAGTKIERGKPIFPRIKIPKSKPAEEAEPVEKSAADEKPKASFDDFMKLEFRVGTCLSAEPVEGADKLYRLKVDIGTEERQVVAGVAHVFPPDELVGKKLVIVANLEPAKIRGVESQGMILAAGEKDPVALVTLDRDVENGERVR
jgi:methionyl-tRNA synthetase